MSFNVQTPNEWERVDGSNEIDDSPDVRWEDNILTLRWKDWEIWIDGGQNVSLYQCFLVDVKSEELEPFAILLRDFVDTQREIEVWINHATIIARRLEVVDEEGSE